MVSARTRIAARPRCPRGRDADRLEPSPVVSQLHREALLLGQGSVDPGPELAADAPNSGSVAPDQVPGRLVSSRLTSRVPIEACRSRALRSSGGHAGSPGARRWLVKVMWSTTIAARANQGAHGARTRRAPSASRWPGPPTRRAAGWHAARPALDARPRLRTDPVTPCRRLYCIDPGCTGWARPTPA